ncbi:MAG: magnesium/cobalt transporter CorA [Saprospirales bacterium]|nr:magnesium/cobalt transporter CorA [Saprospirales bacterium]
MAKRKRIKTGLPPGTLVFTGKQHVKEPNVILLQYHDGEALEQQQKDKLIVPKEGPYSNWYDVRGLHNAELIRQFGELYSIHPLVLEDILNTQQRPKIEEYDNGIFITAQALTVEEKGVELETEQIAIFFGNNFLISFQEKEDDNFLDVRNRLLTASSKLRRKSPDYLAYSLLDNVVDGYYPVLDHLEEQIEELERTILTSPEHDTKSRIHHLKRQLLTLRKGIVPLRDAVARFSRSDSPLIKDDTLVFVRDLSDHTMQIIDTIETYRDLVNGLYELLQSEVSYRTNNVIKVLTIMSSIFIPLTFLAGVYGMNFDYMPELRWKYGYFMVLGVMFLTFILLIGYFRRKKWF